MRAALEDLVPDGPSGRLSSIASGVASGVWKFASPSGRDAAAAADDRLLARERQNNKLLAALHGFGTLQGMLLRAAEATPPAGTALHVLLPQSVTLDDVAITAELVQTHVVFLQNAVPRGAPRAFTSLNGLCGSCEADGSIIVRRRLPHGARAPHAPPVEGGGGGGGDGGGGGGGGPSGPSGWDSSEHACIPQLESQIHVLRDSYVEASEELPLRARVGLLLISDPLFFPGCGWKLPLALRRCSHKWRDAQPDALLLSELPQLLAEYQVWNKSRAVARHPLDIPHPHTSCLTPAARPGPGVGAQLARARRRAGLRAQRRGRRRRRRSRRRPRSRERFARRSRNRRRAGPRRRSRHGGARRPDQRPRRRGERQRAARPILAHALSDRLCRCLSGRCAAAVLTAIAPGRAVRDGGGGRRRRAGHALQHAGAARGGGARAEWRSRRAQRAADPGAGAGAAARGGCVSRARRRLLRS